MSKAVISKGAFVYTCNNLSIGLNGYEIYKILLIQKHVLKSTRKYC